MNKYREKDQLGMIPAGPFLYICLAESRQGIKFIRIVRR